MSSFKTTICFRLFESLTEKEEIRLFGIFLTNTYRKNNAVYNLYKYLRKFYPKFLDEKLDRTYMEQILYRDNNNPRQTLFDATSDLKTQLIDFITIQELKKNEVQRNFLFLDALKSRKLDKLFFKESERIQEKWDDDSIPGIEHFHNQYKLKDLTISHPNLSNLKNLSTFKDILELLDMYYYSAKIYSVLIYINNNNSENIKDKLTNSTINKISEYFEKASFSKKPKLKFLYELLKAFQSNNIEDIHTIKSTFFNLHLYYTQSEKHDIRSILVNLYYSKRNEANVAKALFEITKFSLKEDLILEDGFMTSQFFINSIFIAKKNKDLEWIEMFIKKYKLYLNPIGSEDTILYGEAILAFEKKKYDEVLRNLSKMQLSGVVMGAQINCMKLQCYYELNYNTAVFDHLINATKQYLNNHKKDVSEGEYSMFRNFAIDVNEISKQRRKAKLFGKIDELKIKSMQKRLNQMKTAPFTEWLLEKIMNIRN